MICIIRGTHYFLVNFKVGLDSLNHFRVYVSFSVLYIFTLPVKTHICLEMYEVLTSLCKTNIRNKNDVMENIELKIPYTYK